MSAVVGPSRTLHTHYLDVGCVVWSKAHGLDVRLNSRGEPRGGVILEIVETGGGVDPDTGEIIEGQRAFRCVELMASKENAFVVLPESCVEPDASEPASPTKLRNYSRRLAKWAAESKGPMTGQEARLLTDAAHLAAIALGGH